jgi:hypothetical protein
MDETECPLAHVRRRSPSQFHWRVSFVSHNKPPFYFMLPLDSPPGGGGRSRCSCGRIFSICVAAWAAANESNTITLIFTFLSLFSLAIIRTSLPPSSHHALQPSWRPAVAFLFSHLILFSLSRTRTWQVWRPALGLATLTLSHRFLACLCTTHLTSSCSQQV